MVVCSNYYVRDSPSFTVKEKVTNSCVIHKLGSGITSTINYYDQGTQVV